ncbi:hypothetical protein ACSSS7_002730 [Eimeria intestinalis]
MGRISRDRRDIYYRRAKEEGYRARSAYKLLQLDDELHFLSPPQNGVEEFPEEIALEPWDEPCASADEPVWPVCEESTDNGISKKEDEMSAAASVKIKDSASKQEEDVWEYPHRAVDLCAAPGSWTQVLRRRLWWNYERKLEAYNSLPHSSSHADPPHPPIIVAVDLQELAPIEGVHMLKGDITHASTVAAILSFFQQKPADLVVCDGAPDVTGMRDIDEFIQMQLLLAALSTAAQVLRPGGMFVCKVFRGEQAPLMYMQLMTLFADVRCCKPAASRSSSVEAFVVCRGFTPSISPNPHSPSLKMRTHADSPAEKKAEAEAEATAAQQHQKGNDLVCVTDESIASAWGEVVLGQLVPFLSCGDIRGMDADRNYTLARSSHKPMPPVQPPTHPAYELAVLRRKGLLK